jgi:hypothetical protein
MHVLTWLACAAACGILWLLQELLGSIVGEAIGGLLEWMFSPFTRRLSRLLDGAHGGAWRGALTSLGVAGLGGGLLLFFDGANRGSGAEFLAGAVAAGVGIAGLLWLDGRLHAATVAARRQNLRG